jgi:hypothetical protein
MPANGERCRNGFLKDKKTKRCRKKGAAAPSPARAAAHAANSPPAASPNSYVPKPGKNCKKGTRKNKKTGRCQKVTR